MLKLLGHLHVMSLVEVAFYTDRRECTTPCLVLSFHYLKAFLSLRVPARDILAEDEGVSLDEGVGGERSGRQRERRVTSAAAHYLRDVYRERET